jgi:hypothetical protein
MTHNNVMPNPKPQTKTMSKMKLFIFQPSDRWAYCGGCIAIVAPDLEAVSKLITDEYFYENESDVPSEKSYHIWVLAETFPTDETESRIVICDYNWA